MLRLICPALLLLAASCAPEQEPARSPDPDEERSASAAGTEDGEYRLVPKIHRISADAARRIPHRVLDAVNAIRIEKNLPAVSLSRGLTAAAKTHARDMSVQNRPWHFGSDGSSPISRAAKAGYKGRVLGENISESFESDLDTLAAWMRNPQARKLILKADAARIGIGWHQEREGKIWWTLLVGT